MVEQFSEAAEAQLKKAADNREYLEEMSQSMWEKINNYDHRKNFQQDELTTGQASQIYGVTTATMAHYCELGYIPGAWRDETHKWWHIPASSLDQINRAIVDRGLDWTSRYWVRFYGVQLKNQGNGKR